MKRNFLFSILAFSLGAATLFPYVKDYADNPDTFQYLSIALKYKSGALAEAINGYWGPLISWLLIIPLSLVKVELIAFKILQLLIGIVVLYQWRRTVNHFPFSEHLKNILAFWAIPFVLNYALLNLTPDLLFMCLTLYLLNKAIQGKFFAGKKNSVVGGLAGVLLYFTKAFGLPFFLAFALIVFFQEGKKNLIKSQYYKNAGIFLVTFILFSSLWFIHLSMKYGRFTFSESAAFNLSRDVAPLPSRGDELPVLSNGLIQPERNCISAWETPGYYVSKETLSPFKTPNEYISVVKRNLLSMYYFDFRNQAGIVFLIVLLWFIIKSGFRILYADHKIFYSLSVIVLSYGGYSLILFHTRYAWLNSWLMVLLSVYMLWRIFENRKTTILFNILFYFILLLSLKRPFKEMFFTMDKDDPLEKLTDAMFHPFETLWNTYRPDYELTRDIQSLQYDKKINGNVASLKTKRTGRDSYAQSLRIAGANNCIYFGQLDNALPDEEQLLELKKANIDFYITWDKEWKELPEVFYNPQSGMRVYRVHDKP